MKTWHYIVIAILGALAGVLAHRAYGGVPVKFTVETSRADIQEIPCYHGETLDFEVTMKNYGQNLNLPTNEPAQIFWQTNGMSAFYWRTNNVNIVSNKYFATFTPEMDPGSTTCFGFIGTPKEIYRASFVLRFKNSPGTEPKVMEWPYRELDFNKIEVLNAPWYAQAVVDAKDEAINQKTIAATNAITEAVILKMAEEEEKIIAATNSVSESVPKMVDNALTNKWNVAIGINTRVGDSGTAIGYLASATNVGGTAIGYYARARGWNSLALGGAEATGSSSVAVGYNSKAEGGYSFASPSSAVAKKTGDIALGWCAVSTNDQTTAIGPYSVAGGLYSLSVGKSAKSFGQVSAAIGPSTEADKRLSVAIGYGVKAKSEESVVIGTRSEYEDKGSGTFCLDVYGSDPSRLYIGNSNLVQIINANAPTPTPESIGAYSASDGTNLSQRVNSISNMVANIRIEERYDFADFANMVEALSNIVVRLGGEAYNFPTNINKGIELKKDASGKYYIETEE